MEKSQSITELAKAIVSVMKDVKGIEKTMTVGTGQNSYKGVSDKDVKNAIGKSMEKYGLCLLPTEVEPTLQIDRWTETGGQYGDKQKQSVFTSVKTKYLLIHDSGEYIEVSGYGHGTDSQDKAAGKATTYALKYAMLYLFLVPTGKIDDADATHSDEIETPKMQPKKKALSEVGFNKLLSRIVAGETSAYDAAKGVFELTADQVKQADKILKNLPSVNQLKTA